MPLKFLYDIVVTKITFTKIVPVTNVALPARYTALAAVTIPIRWYVHLKVPESRICRALLHVTSVCFVLRGSSFCHSNPETRRSFSHRASRCSFAFSIFISNSSFLIWLSQKFWGYMKADSSVCPGPIYDTPPSTFVVNKGCIFFCYNTSKPERQNLPWAKSFVAFSTKQVEFYQK
jgi:hypothetical protein